MNQTGDKNSLGSTVILQDEGLRKLKGFVQIPKVILLHKDLSYGAKVGYGVLLGYAWQEDFCFPAQQSLADDLGCSVRQARRLLEELKERKLISWKQIGLNKPNIYYILPLPSPQKDNSPAIRKGSAGREDHKKTTQNLDRTNMSAPDRTKMSHQEETNMSYKEYPKNNTQNTVTVNANADQVKEEKTDLRKLPDIEQPKDKTQYIADEIYGQLLDKQSKGSYYLVAAKVPESVIRQALAEIKQGGARSPAKVFTSKIKTYATDKLVAHNGQKLLADMAVVAREKAFS